MAVKVIKTKELAEDFIPMIPRELPIDKRVSANGVRLWVILQHFVYSGYEFPTLRDLTNNELKLSTTTVSKALDNLENAGWIKREKTSVTGNIHYTLYLVPNEVEYVPENQDEEMPEIEVGTITLANRKPNNATAPKRFGRNVR